MKKKYIGNILTVLVVVGVLATAITVAVKGITTTATLWAMLPPIVAI